MMVPEPQETGAYWENEDYYIIRENIENMKGFLYKHNCHYSEKQGVRQSIYYDNAQDTRQGITMTEAAKYREIGAQKQARKKLEAALSPTIPTLKRGYSNELVIAQRFDEWLKKHLSPDEYNSYYASSAFNGISVEEIKKELLRYDTIDQRKAKLYTVYKIEPMHIDKIMCELKLDTLTRKTPPHLDLTSSLSPKTTKWQGSVPADRAMAIMNKRELVEYSLGEYRRIEAVMAK